MSEKLAPARLSNVRDLAATVQTVSAVPVDLMICNVVNNQAAIAFIQLFDTVGAVTLATTNPDFEFQVGANLTLTLPLSACGLRCNAGLKVASTTTEKGLTGSAAGVQVFFGTQG
jgi:hypothetical protein